MLSFWQPRGAAATNAATRPTGAEGCPLVACAPGERATVVSIGCAADEARRLRTLGVFEGAEIGIVGTQNGILLDVCGSRLALDLAAATTILVRPVAP